MDANEVAFHRLLGLPTNGSSRSTTGLDAQIVESTLSRAATRQVSSLARHRLARSGGDASNATSAHGLDESRRRMYNLLAVDASHAVISSLKSVNIDAMAFKGQALAADVYGDPLLRDSNDIDVVVRPRDVLATVRSLIAAGYESTVAVGWFESPFFLSHCGEAPLTTPDGNFMIDLHWSFGPPWYAQPIDADEVLAASNTLKVLEHEWRWCAPQQVWRIQLAHVMSCEWRESKALLDLAHSSDRLTNEDWVMARDATYQRGAKNAFDAALLVLAVLFERIPPEEMLVVANSNTHATSIAAWSLSGLGKSAEAEPGLRRVLSGLSMSSESGRLNAVAKRVLSPMYVDFIGQPPAASSNYALYAQTLLRRLKRTWGA